MQTFLVDQLVGQILGNYRVERLLGHGRLNAVYLAQHQTLRRTDALTLYIVPERFSPEARNRFMSRFLQEATAITALEHPCILPIYEYGEQFGCPYLVTPYMMNGSLADIIKQQGRCSHEEILEILEQVVAGLEYAHSRGLVHGTLKPSNMVLDREKNLLVAGFGLMHMLQIRGVERSDRPYAHLFSIADTFLVAPEYIAPEIVQGQSIDMRSDIYALGAILFELLSGRPPFTGVNPIDIAEQHVKQMIPSLRAIRPDIPVALESVINQALAREPARRFQSATELAEAFVQVSLGLRLSTKQEGLPRLDEIKAPPAMAPSTEPQKGHVGGKRNNWQLMPPILTDKVVAASASTPRVVTPTAESSFASPDSWQLLPPIVTGHLPKIELPKSLPVESMSPPTLISLPADTSAEAPEPFEWWSQSPQELSSSKGDGFSLGWGEAELIEPPFVPAKRPRPSAKRSSSLNRRQVVALLGTGVVVVAGALVAVNVNLGRMMENVINPHNPQTTNTDNQTQGQATPSGSPQKQPTGGHTGVVIGSIQMATNTSADFVNPTDHKMSLLVHLPDGNFAAYEKVCTHEGVNVHYDAATHTLVCPAHGAVFDPANGGKVLQGPATKPLTNVITRINSDGTITTG